MSEARKHLETEVKAAKYLGESTVAVSVDHLNTLLKASPPGGGEVVYVAHKFWGAGEPDCPADIKASNGELHTLRCKVCGKNSDRNPCSAIVSRQVTEEMIDAAYEAYADMYDVEYTQGSHIDNRRACIKAALQAALEAK